MGRSFFGLTSSGSGSNITIMSSKTLLFLFGVLIFVAFVAAFNEEEMEDGEISELTAVERFVRDADPRGKRKAKKGKNGKKGPGKGNAGKTGRKSGGKKKKVARKNGESKKNKSKNNSGKNPGKKETSNYG